MALTHRTAHQLLKRLRFMGILLLSFSAGFFAYSFFSEEQALPPSIVSEGKMETAGPELLSLEDGDFFNTPTRQIFLLGSLAFSAIGLATLLFAHRKLKQIDRLPKA